VGDWAPAAKAETVHAIHTQVQQTARGNDRLTIMRRVYALRRC
jgi:hypothetical protein